MCTACTYESFGRHTDQRHKKVERNYVRNIISFNLSRNLRLFILFICDIRAYRSKMLGSYEWDVKCITHDIVGLRNLKKVKMISFRIRLSSSVTCYHFTLRFVDKLMCYKSFNDFVIDSDIRVWKVMHDWGRK